MAGNESFPTTFETQRLPALPVLLAVILGVLLSLFLDLTPGFLFFASLLILVVSGLVLRKFLDNTATLIAVLILFASVASLRTSLAIERNARFAAQSLARDSQEATVIGRVKSVQAEADRDRILLCAPSLSSDSISISMCGLCIWVNVDSLSSLHLEYGDLVLAHGTFRAASETATASPAAFTSTIVNGVAGVLIADSCNIVVEKQGGFRVRRSIDKFRSWISDTFDIRLSRDGATLCKALVLGDRGDFSDTFSDRVRLTGLSHIFALSGMNVGLVISLFWLLLGFLFIPNSVRLWILLFVLALYMELGREVPSLVRASLMSSFFIVGRLLNRRAEILNYVCAAACVELIWRPMDLLDAGFQLSYLAVLGILGCYSMLHLKVISLLGHAAGWKKLLGDILAGTLSAQVGTIPLVGLLFHRIPFVGILGNVLAVPGFAILLFWSILLLIAQPLFSPFALAISGAINLLAYVLGKVVVLLSGFPLASLHVPDLSALTIFVLYIALVFAVVGLYFLRPWWTAAAALAGLNMIVWASSSVGVNPSARITFLNVGMGDATLISSGDGHAVLVDAGPASKQWTAANKIVPYLNTHGVNRLDALILTHPENDHIGGAAALLRRIPVNTIYVNGDSSDSRAYQELQLVINELGVAQKILSAGDILHIGSAATLTTLYPDSLRLRNFHQHNQKALVFRVDAQGSSALLCADIDSTVEQQLISWGSVLDVDLLKVAHHGSKGSSCVSFLKSVTPNSAVISASSRNNYDLPSEAALRRFADLNVPVVKTASEGDVEFISTPSGWREQVNQTKRLAARWKLPYG